MVKPIEKQNVADTVYYTMLNMIIEGEWKQESMIPSENELREGFSVSRDTVRQAIHRLKALGVLQSQQGKGTYVQKIDTSFYLNLMVPAVFLNEDDGICILEFMKAIQVESVRIVCERSSDEEIAVLSDYLTLMRSTKDGDYENYFNHDIGYHFYLVQLTKNNLFEKAMDIIEKLLHVCLRDIVAFHGSEKSLQQHEDCFEAIQRRDADRAVGIMAEHYDMLTDRLRQWLNKAKVN
jgi:GntR family transcriptional repressor for pyruvate dehydrogenase complex